MYSNAACTVIAVAICSIAVILLFIPGIFKGFKLKFSNKGWKPVDGLCLLEIMYYAIPDWLA